MKAQDGLEGNRETRPRVGVSLFDLDGTLYKGDRHYVIIDLPYFLHTLDERLFKSIQLTNLGRLLASAKSMSRDMFAREVLRNYFGGIGDPEPRQQAIEDFWSRKVEEDWFPYASQLVELMNRCTITILISGSPFEALQHVKDRFGFGELHGSVDADDERATASAKRRLIRLLKQRYHFDPAISFAFGDSESDIPLLKAVSPRNAFVLGANEKVGKYAKRNGIEDWQFIGYNDDVLGKVTGRVREMFPEAF